MTDARIPEAMLAHYEHSCKILGDTNLGVPVAPAKLRLFITAYRLVDERAERIAELEEALFEQRNKRGQLWNSRAEALQQLADRDATIAEQAERIAELELALAKADEELEQYR